MLKRINIAALIAVTLLMFSSLVACDNDVDDSPWKFNPEGEWRCSSGGESIGEVQFNADGSGSCLTTTSDGKKEISIPFTYSFTKVEMEGTLVITSSASATDYPNVDSRVIALNPDTYTLSPTTTDKATIHAHGSTQILWQIIRPAAGNE